MKNASSMTQLSVAVTVALALGASLGAAGADDRSRSSGYLTDKTDGVVKSGYGLCWHSGFGPEPLSAAACEPIVADVQAPAGPAAPQPAVQTAAEPARERLSFDADTLFDFDRSELRPAGIVALRAFVGKLKAIEPDMIQAVGHTDRLGTDDYNRRLSEQRVEAVKAYLVSQGIDAANVHTEAKGASEPITRLGECPGVQSASVIACLQPDRRVEVEVNGVQVAL